MKTVKQYVIHFGSSVPYTATTVSSWIEACKFMKQNLDNNVPIHSVHYEKLYDNSIEYY